MPSVKTILLAEDNEDDVFFMKRAILRANVAEHLQIVQDGEEAVAYLSGTGPYQDRDKFPLPCLILLDLKLPLLSGLEVLKWIRAQRHLESIVIVVLTSSRESSDIQRAYDLGANSYLVKPAAAEDLIELIKALKAYWLQRNEFPVL
jgi:CheY-like chemotaxis protein